MLRRSKGILKSFEAVIAILMIMSIFLMFYGPVEEIPEFRSINWKIRGFTALEALDSRNELRAYVLENNSLGIEQKLQKLLPGEIDYAVYICKTTCVPAIASEELVSITYILAGNVSTFEPRYVTLYMW